MISNYDQLRKYVNDEFTTGETIEEIHYSVMDHIKCFRDELQNKLSDMLD